jgi:hypothetical protein
MTEDQERAIRRLARKGRRPRAILEQGQWIPPQYRGKSIPVPSLHRIQGITVGMPGANNNDNTFTWSGPSGVLDCTLKRPLGPAWGTVWHRATRSRGLRFGQPALGGLTKSVYYYYDVAYHLSTLRSATEPDSRPEGCHYRTRHTFVVLIPGAKLRT